VKPPDSYSTSHFNSRLHLVRKKNKLLREAHNPSSHSANNNPTNATINAIVPNHNNGAHHSESLAMSHNRGRPRSLSQDGDHGAGVSPRRNSGGTVQQQPGQYATSNEGFAKIQGEINRTPNTLIFRSVSLVCFVLLFVLVFRFWFIFVFLFLVSNYSQALEMNSSVRRSYSLPKTTKISNKLQTRLRHPSGMFYLFMQLCIHAFF
jgi:hypothetical protein